MSTPLTNIFGKNIISLPKNQWRCLSARKAVFPLLKRSGAKPLTSIYIGPSTPGASTKKRNCVPLTIEK